MKRTALMNKFENILRSYSLKYDEDEYDEAKKNDKNTSYIYIKDVDQKEFEFTKEELELFAILLKVSNDFPFKITKSWENEADFSKKTLKEYLDYYSGLITEIELVDDLELKYLIMSSLPYSVTKLEVENLTLFNESISNYLNKVSTLTSESRNRMYTIQRRLFQYLDAEMFLEKEKVQLRVANDKKKYEEELTGFNNQSENYAQEKIEQLSLDYFSSYENTQVDQYIIELISYFNYRKRIKELDTLRKSGVPITKLSKRLEMYPNKKNEPLAKYLKHFQQTKKNMREDTPIVQHMSTMFADGEDLYTHSLKERLTLLENRFEHYKLKEVPLIPTDIDDVLYQLESLQMALHFLIRLVKKKIFPSIADNNEKEVQWVPYLRDKMEELNHYVYEIANWGDRYFELRHGYSIEIQYIITDIRYFTSSSSGYLNYMMFKIDELAILLNKSMSTEVEEVEQVLNGGNDLLNESVLVKAEEALKEIDNNLRNINFSARAIIINIWGQEFPSQKNENHVNDLSGEFLIQPINKQRKK